MTQAIEIENLTRVFRFSANRVKTEVTALDGVTMEISRGEIVGLLGPNGAGKTTLIKIISTALLPTSGSVRVLGADVAKHPAAVRDRIGIVFGGERGLYGRLTVQDNLDYWSSMYHVRRQVRRTRIPELLELVGLTDHKHVPVDRLSRGMKQRVHLARGLVNDPELLILDEPTSGLDPVGSHQFRTLIEQLRKDGRTILVATHDMTEAEQLCNRIALIDRGKLRGISEPKAIGRWLTAYERVDTRGLGDDLLAKVRGLDGVGRVEDLDDGWVRIHTTSDVACAVVLKLLVDSGIKSIRTSLPSLEDVYLQVIGDRGLKV